MGRKRNRRGQHLLFYLAPIILLWLSGCALLKPSGSEMDWKGNLARGQQLREAGEYEPALEVYREILAAYPQDPPGDIALREIAMLTIHPGRSQKKYQESLDTWWKLLRGFPNSPYAEEARSWISLLTVYLEVQGQSEKTKAQLVLAKIQTEHCKNQLEDLRQELKTIPVDLTARNQKLIIQKDFDRAVEENQAVLSRNSQKPPSDEALYTLGLIYAHADNPKKDPAKALGFFHRLLKEFPRSPRAWEARAWMKTIELFEQSKRIDLEIDIKRKQLRR